jgi:hypothetical protein
MGVTMKRTLLFTTAICGISLLAAPMQAQANTLTTTITTNHSYAFPDSTPIVSSSVSVDGNCPGYVRPPVTHIGGGSDGNQQDVSHSIGVDAHGNEVSLSITSQDGYVTGVHSHGGGGGGGGGVCVLCTYFHIKGMLPTDIYEADLSYGREKASADTLNGYHAWAIPLVKTLQTGNHPYLEKFLHFWVKSWAYEMAYVMGVTQTSNPVGRAMRLVGEPLCALVGKFAKAQNYKALWA